jgi:hypothetical protein
VTTAREKDYVRSEADLAADSTAINVERVTAIWKPDSSNDDDVVACWQVSELKVASSIAGDYSLDRASYENVGIPKRLRGWIMERVDAEHCALDHA